MKRILQITALWMGVLLIALTGELGFVRQQHGADPVVLVVGKSITHRGSTGVYLAGVGSKARQRVLPPFFYFEALMWSPDGHWFYGIAARTAEEYDTDNRVIWRVSHDARHAEVLDGSIPLFSSYSFAISPDSKWVFYVARVSGGYALMRIQASDGQQARNLTPDGGLQVEYPFHAKVFENHGAWVYVWDRTRAERVPVEGGHVENVAPADLIANIGEWLLFASDQTVYLTDPAGQHVRLLFPENSTIPESYINDVVWLQESDWVVVETYSGGDSTLQAYDLADGRLVWRYPNLRLARPIQRGGWILASDIVGTLVVIGGTAETTARTVLERDEYALLPFFGGLPLFMRAAGSGYALWRLFPDGTTRKVYGPVSTLIALQRVSSDGAWAAFRDDDTARYDTLLLKLDGTRAYRLHGGVVVEWLPPIDRAWSPIGLLISGGLLTVGGMMRGGAIRKLKL